MYISFELRNLQAKREGRDLADEFQRLALMVAYAIANPSESLFRLNAPSNARAKVRTALDIQRFSSKDTTEFEGTEMEEPSVLLDQHDCIIAWYLPEALFPDRVVSIFRAILHRIPPCQISPGRLQHCH
jgi:hypothetical protein